jgi:hypothetical protein
MGGLGGYGQIDRLTDGPTDKQTDSQTNLAIVTGGLGDIRHTVVVLQDMTGQSGPTKSERITSLSVCNVWYDER